MQRWVERAEARWALWAGIAGAAAMSVVATAMILSHQGSLAAFGFVFVPLIAAAAAVSRPAVLAYELWSRFAPR